MPKERFLKTEDIDILRSPIDCKKLSIERLVKTSSDHITKAILISTSGHNFKINDGIANFVTKKSVDGEALNALKYYNEIYNLYDEYLPIAFELFNADERETRLKLIDKLDLSSNSTVLDLTTGTGEDSCLILERISEGKLWMSDLSKNMLLQAKKKISKINNVDTPTTYLNFDMSNNFPIKSNYFDRVFSFTGLGGSTNVKKSLSEINRVLKKGGKAVIIEKSVPPWMKGSSFSNILIAGNPMFANQIPLDLLPHNIANVSLSWIMQNTFYVIEFTKSKLPSCNFDLPLPGTRGGSFNTRYYGHIESAFKWLDSVISEHAKTQLTK
jgi:ubiquinone/menaquinone biosynthesis C-methylase UbiE